MYSLQWIVTFSKPALVKFMKSFNENVSSFKAECCLIKMETKKFNKKKNEVNLNILEIFSLKIISMLNVVNCC